ncbi:RING finger protein [Schistosoma japonicum]|nr:RING finger protein [Schistosoma japonicum]
MGVLFESLDDHVVIFMSLPAIVLFLVGVRVVWGYFQSCSRRIHSNQMSERIRDRSNSDYDCPICMEFPSLMVETNCGHRFCAECFILHWKRTVYSRIISCPMCRGQVSTLTELFTAEELRGTSNRRSKIEADLRLFNRWHSGGPISIIDRIRDIPLFVYGFIQLLLSGEGTFALMQIRLTLLGLCVLFYLITPFDFIPDVVAGFLGILDDIIVLCIFTIHVVSVYQTISSRRELTR